MAYHGAVFEAVMNTYLPALKSIEFKALVEKIAPNFAAHREAAEALLKKQ